MDGFHQTTERRTGQWLSERRDVRIDKLTDWWYPVSAVWSISIYRPLGNAASHWSGEPLRSSPDQCQRSDCRSSRGQAAPRSLPEPQPRPSSLCRQNRWRPISALLVSRFPKSTEANREMWEIRQLPRVSTSVGLIIISYHLHQSGIK